MPFWVSRGSRFQICPGVPKELEAGDAAIRATVVVIVVVIAPAHMMQRRTSFRTIEPVWRDSACKDSAERRDIPFACGPVDGAHVSCTVIYESAITEQPSYAEYCAQALRDELWPAMWLIRREKVVCARR